jgi:Domain of unknown function (DUF4111)/Nucleotidyltransferase domain
VGEVAAYLGELTRRLVAVADVDLVGVYVGGSYALGAYEPGRSDLDVAAVVRSPATCPSKEAIVDAIRHESLRCPARGLEFVLYGPVIRRPLTAAGFELNLNTGAAMDFRAEFAPNGNENHWFPIDRSILRQCGIALFGPPAMDVFGALPRRLLVPLVLESVKWHSAGDARGDDAVLNACRAWRYAIEDVWSSKPVAGAWALAQPGTPRLVAEALEARHGNARLDPTAVERFLLAIATKIERVAEEPAAERVRSSG